VDTIQIEVIAQMVTGGTELPKELAVQVIDDVLVA
jgi:hypothetical protein